MERRQLEIRFQNPLDRRQPRRGRRPKTRARWWFEQMRRTVDAALEWQPTPTPGRPPDRLAPASEAVGAGPVVLPTKAG
jgi:hypothetical protein